MHDNTEIRNSVRRRSAAWMALIVSPVILFVAAIKILEPHDYPTGDIRNESLFWLLIGIAALALVGALVLGSIRDLRRDDPR